MTDPGLRAISALGFCCMIAIAWLCSTDRTRFPWRTVLWGIGFQSALNWFGSLRAAIGRVLFQFRHWFSSPIAAICWNRLMTNSNFQPAPTTVF